MVAKLFLALVGLVGVAAPWINRALMAKRIWNQFSQSRHTNSHTDNRNETRMPTEMTREQAYKVLNLPANASKQAGYY